MAALKASYTDYADRGIEQILTEISAYRRILLRAFWLLLAGCLGMVACVRLLTAVTFPGGFPDPFASYETIMPGAPRTALAEFGCQISPTRINGIVYPGARTSCSIFPQGGLFRMVIAVAEQDQINQLSFYGRQVSLAHLFEHWRAPGQNRADGQGLRLAWRTSGYIVRVTTDEFRLDAPVNLVLVTMNR